MMAKPFNTLGAASEPVGKNKHLTKSGKKGAKKKIVDPLSKKEQCEEKAPAMLDEENIQKT